MQKDKTRKILEDYNDVFADIYNVLVFGEKFLPTITIIINFSDKEWNEPKSLHELFCRRLGKVDVWVDDRQEIKHVEEVLDFFRVFTKDERYEELLTEEIKSMVEKGEKVNMCIVLDTIEQRGIERGIQMGIEQGISQGRLGLLKKWVEKGRMTLEEAAEEMEVTVVEMKEILS